jgi:hypothetical protein
MLLEAMVGVFALSCVMVLASDAKVSASDADAVYARGIGNWMHLCGVPLQFAIGFGLLAFSHSYSIRWTCARVSAGTCSRSSPASAAWSAA